MGEIVNQVLLCILGTEQTTGQVLSKQLDV